LKVFANRGWGSDMSITDKRTEGELITPDLERVGFFTWLSDAIGRVVTNAIRSWGVTGRNSTLIGEAWELYDMTTGENALVGHEVALISKAAPGGLAPKRAVFDAVLKGRMDWQPQGPRRDVPNSTGFWLSTQPEVRAESVCSADPDSLFGGAVDIRGNPGASVFNISADMLRAGRCAPGIVDGHRVAMPLVDADQPAIVIDQVGGNAWFGLRDYGHRQQGILEGTGAFLSFQSMNSAGAWGDWVLLNGGLIDRTPGREQGDLDMLVYVDGQINGVAIYGSTVRAGGPPAGMVPVVSGTLNLGNKNNRWQDICMAGKLDVPTVRKRINGVECDCVAIESQLGVRYIPAYEEDR
jgi:hypothetical protein